MQAWKKAKGYLDEGLVTLQTVVNKILVLKLMAAAI